MSYAPAIRLSHLDERDVVAVQQLHIESFRVLATNAYGGPQVAAYVRTLEAPRYRNELLACQLRVVFDDDGRPVATAGWTAAPGQPDTARIRKVFVHPEHTRRGLARLLTVDAEHRALRAGRHRLVLRANLNAIPLYTRLGYVEGPDDEMAAAGGLLLPVRWMTKH